MASQLKKRAVSKPTPAEKYGQTLVARRIEETRKAKGLSRQDVADRLNAIDVNPKATRLHVWRIETGFTEITAEHAAEFATALDISVASLFREARAS